MTHDNEDVSNSQHVNRGQQSPLRGELADNDLDGDLHDMGGNIGPASDATAAAEPEGPGSDGLRDAEARAEAQGATAVDSPPQGTLRDDPDDPAGGDTSSTTSTEAPRPVDDDVDVHEVSAGRGADGDTEARLDQKRHGGP